MNQPDPVDWRQRAACASITVAVMYPAHNDTAGWEHAKSICAACPVAVACLDEALANGETDGCWGGTSEEERQLLRRSLRSAGRVYLRKCCAWCGSTFVFAGGAGNEPNRRYCSADCSGSAERAAAARSKRRARSRAAV